MFDEMDWQSVEMQTHKNIDYTFAKYQVHENRQPDQHA